MTEPLLNTVIVGGGPAALAPLLAASHRGMLGSWLSNGLAIVERGGRIGGGRIGEYAINSDSSAETFLSCLRHNPQPRLARLLACPAAVEIARHGTGAVPLMLVGRLMDRVGEVLHGLIVEQAGGEVLLGHEALQTRRRADKSWSTRVRSVADGRSRDLVSRNVLIATGGTQPHSLLEQEPVAGQPLLPRYRDKLVQSDIALTEAGLAMISRRLQAIENPRIAIIGGSTSAVSCARALLARMGETLRPGAITILHRRALTLFYPSADAARAEQYAEFGPDDICPVSGFVFRFGGLRFDSRELIMQVRGLAGRRDENRVMLHRIAGASEGARTHPAWSDSRRVLDEADLILGCLGYQARALPVFDETGARIALHGEMPGAALVGPNSGVLDSRRQEIPGLFGIGLAAGFVASPAMGGERSFSGQMNGLWLWQNDIGAAIATRMLHEPGTIGMNHPVPAARPGGGDISALYSVIADGYDGSYDRPSHRRVYDRLAWEHASAIQLPAEAHVVDAGCGTGRWIPRWLERGHRVTGIEPAPGMVRVLRARALGERFHLLEEGMERAQIAAGSADLVLAMGSMQYASDPAAMIQRFGQWVRPGGAVCVYVDGLVSLVLELLRDGRHDEASERLRSRRGVFRQGEQTASLALYDRQTLEAQFEAAGLVDVRCYGLAIGASAAGRDGCTAAMQRDEETTMASERMLSLDPAMADAGLHIMAIGYRPDPDNRRRRLSGEDYADAAPAAAQCR